MLPGDPLDKLHNLKIKEFKKHTMITLLKIGVEVEGDRSHVLISLVGQVLTNIIRRHVYLGLVDAKSTCQPIVG